MTRVCETCGHVNYELVEDICANCGKPFCTEICDSCKGTGEVRKFWPFVVLPVSVLGCVGMVGLTLWSLPLKKGHIFWFAILGLLAYESWQGIWHPECSKCRGSGRMRVKK